MARAALGDVHASFGIYCRDALQQRFPGNLRARVEEQVFVETDDDNENRFISLDVRVLEYPGVPGGKTSDTVVATAEPYVIESLSEPRTERWIEIRDFSTGGRVVTVIEFVSAANKVGRGYEMFLRKRRECLAANVNFVQIDLLRAGEDLCIEPKRTLPPECQTPWLIGVCRVHPAQKWEIYRVPIDQPLPTIRIPLRPTDEDCPLELQSVLGMAYDRGGYDLIDYSEPPNPPLHGPLADWVTEFLKQRKSPA